MQLPKTPKSPNGDDLTPAQKKAWGEMRQLLINLSKADAAYDALDESKNGTVISSDIARLLDPRYAKNPSLGGEHDIVPSWDLAWRYAQNRLMRELNKSGKNKLLRLMAGGWAAGKTYAVRHLPYQPDLTWDGTLSDPTFAAGTIDHAIHQGWKVEIAYIYRNLELALYAAHNRAKDEGRSVPMNQLPASHRDAQKSVTQLATLYAANPKISFVLLHNLGKDGIQLDALRIQLKDLEQHGALHYLEYHEQYYASASKHFVS